MCRPRRWATAFVAIWLVGAIGLPCAHALGCAAMSPDGVARVCLTGTHETGYRAGMSCCSARVAPTAPRAVFSAESPHDESVVQAPAHQLVGVPSAPLPPPPRS